MRALGKEERERCRSWGNEMSDAQGPQGALELAPGVGVVIAGNWGPKRLRPSV